MLQLPGLLSVLLAAFLICVFREPRSMRTALLLLALLMNLALTAIGFSLGIVQLAWDAGVAGRVLLALLVFMLITVLVLAGALIATGITLIRREGFAVSRLLSIGLGVGMIGYLVVVIGTVIMRAAQPAVIVVLLGLPLAYLGFGFVAFVLYGALYPAVMARRGGPVAAVIVLGSGLIDGRVPPLLASRLDRGRQLVERFAQQRPVLVTSGGQGPDEPRPEAVAMAEYLVGDGVPSDRILLEDRSRTTEENLTNSRDLLASRGIIGPVASVSNNFHAFRAALLMRRLGIPGYAIGAPTARYYWASAVIREYVAVLRDHLVLNAVLVGLSLAPALVFGIVALANR